MTVAYRFFDNQKVTYDKILELHAHETHERVREPKVEKAEDASDRGYGEFPLVGRVPQDM